MQKHEPWTPDEEQRASSLYLSGQSKSAIGRALGRSKDSVAWKLRELGTRISPQEARLRQYRGGDMGRATRTKIASENKPARPVVASRRTTGSPLLRYVLFDISMATNDVVRVRKFASKKEAARHCSGPSHGECRVLFRGHKFSLAVFSERVESAAMEKIADAARRWMVDHPAPHA